LPAVAPSHYAQQRKGFWHEPDGTPTSEAIALETWARVARDILVRTAATYHAVVRDSDLAEELKTSTQIHTTRHHDQWLPKVLGPIAVFCERMEEPNLTALVVGTSDDLVAARERLECYQWAGSAPADGGVPAQLPGSAPKRPVRPRAASASRSSAPAAKPRVAKSDRPVSVCPTCFMALPATGVCDNCE
jgi:hypothetical protein